MTAKKQDETISQKIVLRFPPEIVNSPIVCRLTLDYGLTFNILRANVNPDEEGVLVIELNGNAENYRKGLKYLESSGVILQPLSQNISRDEERCTHCGACAAICPVGAFAIDELSREVEFKSEKCIACELCLRACPLQAMVIEI